MVRRSKPRRRRLRRSSRQIFRENGAVAIKSEESYSVGADGLEIPNTRSFRALALTLHLCANNPLLVQTELWGPGNRTVWRSAPTSVGLTPIRRTFRWPTSAGAMWSSTSKDTIFKITTPCSGKVFRDSYVSINYVVTVALSADYDQQVCPIKQHGIISSIVNLHLEELPSTSSSFSNLLTPLMDVRDQPTSSNLEHVRDGSNHHLATPANHEQVRDVSCDNLKHVRDEQTSANHV